MMFILANLLLATGLRLSTQTSSPVEKVVELINELKAKIEADGAMEQKTYDKFACWCEKTTQRKADSIDAGKALIGTTTTSILTLKGAIAVLASEISEHEAEIAKNNDEMKKLTGIREKENADYQEDKAYKETAISSLHQAIEVLNGAGAPAVTSASSPSPRRCARPCSTRRSSRRSRSRSPRCSRRSWRTRTSTTRRRPRPRRRTRRSPRP